jgi:DNA-binding transcriptional LysR family regulator
MKNELGELAAFATVAEERSFTRAAARLGVSQSALSHTMRGLEKRLGLQLLARTTRSVAPTAAGSALLKDLAPALEQIENSLAEARKLRERPAGRVRLIRSRSAAYMVLLPKLGAFAKAYPDIVLDVVTMSDSADLVAGEFDAGIQIGEFIQRDMIAIRVSNDLRLALVGSPEYFKSHKVPRRRNHPAALAALIKSLRLSKWSPSEGVCGLLYGYSGKLDENFPFGAQKDYSHESQRGRLPETPHGGRLELSDIWVTIARATKAGEMVDGGGFGPKSTAVIGGTTKAEHAAIALKRRMDGLLMEHGLPDFSRTMG